MSVLAYVLASDDRLSGRLLEWQPPGWSRVWMLAASRLGDGWLWLATALLLAASGDRGLSVLSAGAVSAGLANVLLLCVKGRIRRSRPCERTRPRHFDVNPLGWFSATALLSLGPRPQRVRHRQRHRSRLPARRGARPRARGERRGVARGPRPPLALGRARGGARGAPRRGLRLAGAPPVEIRVR